MPGAAKATTVSTSSVKGRGRRNIKAEPSDDEFEDIAPKKQRAAIRKPPKKKVKEVSDNYDASSDDDKPIAPKKTTASRKRKIKAESEAEASSDDDKPILKKPPPKSQAKKVKKEEEGASGSDTPKPKQRATKAKEGVNGTPVKGKGKKKEKKEEEEQEEVFRWWEADGNGDGTVKWQTLEHNGVIFPPPYEPLPSHVKMKYNGINYFFSSKTMFCLLIFSRIQGKRLTCPLLLKRSPDFMLPC
jgi:DNA topoisomerase I